MTAKLFLLGLFVMSMLLMAYRKRKKRIVFFGDSITKQGNGNNGFIRHILKTFTGEGLDEKYELVASGIGGNKVTDLAQRIDKDVLAKGADVVVLFIGVNDVWHNQQGAGTPFSDFQIIYKQLIERLLAAEIKVLLCTPTSIGEKHYPQNMQDDELEMYCNVIRHYADEFELPSIDLRNAFKEHSFQNNPDNFERGLLTTDGVHLNDAGNKFVADRIGAALLPMLT